jgi:hypothetical protein
MLPLPRKLLHSHTEFRNTFVNGKYIADISNKGFGLIINSIYRQRLTAMIKRLCALNCNDKNLGV